MAMSLKKIGAIAVGGAMVASAFAGAVMAEVTTVGDIKTFMKEAVKDGQPNVDIVVGSEGAAMDVVSASDIAAKIGSMCYKDGKVEDGEAVVNADVSSDSELTNKNLNDYMGDGNYTLILTSPKRTFTSNFYNSAILGGLVEDNVTNTTYMYDEVGMLARLPTLIYCKDVDPNDISSDHSADGAEFLLTSLYKKENDSYEVHKKDAVYMSLVFKDGKKDINDLQPLYIGMEIPFLGKMVRIVDTDGDKIYLGDEVFSGLKKDGESVDVGNGYTVKINGVVKTIEGSTPKVNIEILKDGEVVASKDDTPPFELRYGSVGVDVFNAYEDIGQNYGFASLIVTKNVKEYQLGKEAMPDWKIYAVERIGGQLQLKDNDFKETYNASLGLEKELLDKDNNNAIYGLALKYDGDKVDGLGNGDTFAFPEDYAYLKLTDDDEDKAIYAKYEMDLSKTLTLMLGQNGDVSSNVNIELKDILANAQQVVPVKVPIAKLDTEVSLDKAEKNLILVGGPVVNKLTKALQEEGKVNIDNNSPPTIQVVSGAANGHDVLVVAGGNREATREAAKYLIENY